MESKFIYSLSLILLVLFSCKTETVKNTDPNTIEKNQRQKADSLKLSKLNFSPKSTSDHTAAILKNSLTEEYLKDDISFLNENDRKFQFYEIDLNNDGKEEIFVRFMGPYFCGSGGCTFLLLDHHKKVITKFTVTRAPIYVENTKVNGWSVLLVKDSDVFKELVFKNGSYPSNPTVLEKAPYDAPSGHAEVLFHDEMFPCKTFNF